MYVLVNKKTKRYGRFDHLRTAFIDTDDIFFAKKFYSINIIKVVLHEFRIKTKYEIHEITITHKKVKI